MRWVGGLKPPSSAVRVVTGRVATGRVLSKNKLSSKQMKIYCTDGQLNPSGSEESFGIPSQLQAGDLPTQGDAAVAGIDPIDYINRQLQDILKPPSTEDYLAVSVSVVVVYSLRASCSA